MRAAKAIALAVVPLTILSARSLGQLSSSLREQQERFPRVRAAEQEKDAALRALFKKKGIAYPPRTMLLLAFKKEAQLELWASSSEGDALKLVKTYAICATSGRLGPKRRFGDVQVPEGFYDLDWFNPQSNFYLSMHISYPNAADRILGSRTNLGGDIFLHGNCVTIGCIPITDDGIKEVYWLGVLVRSSRQRHLPIYIFPARLTPEGLKSLAAEQHPNQPTLAFWTNLREGYSLFENSHRPLRVQVLKDGNYAFAGEISSSEVR
jgi:murein L,D-transpeptidase YafK